MSEAHDQREIRAAIARHMETIRQATRKIQVLLRYLKVPRKEPK